MLVGVGWQQQDAMLCLWQQPSSWHLLFSFFCRSAQGVGVRRRAVLVCEIPAGFRKEMEKLLSFPGEQGEDACIRQYWGIKTLPESFIPKYLLLRVYHRLVEITKNPILSSEAICVPLLQVKSTSWLCWSRMLVALQVLIVHVLEIDKLSQHFYCFCITSLFWMWDWTTESPAYFVYLNMNLMKATPRCLNHPLEAVIKKCQLMYQVSYFAKNEFGLGKTF